ncbi:MAG: Fic family protein [Bacillota bacterium]|nr:Fic family protein [Bacillota bacterium]
MRIYDYEQKWKDLLEPDIVSLLTTIHEYRGKETLYMEAKKDVLESLMDIAKIQSTDASNRIEGIYTSSERLKKIVRDKTAPKSRSEKEIAGYRDVLTTIHKSYEYIPVKASSILQLHRDLYKFTGGFAGGNYKEADNEITEVDSNGQKRVRFQPVHAWETPESIEKLCEAYNAIVGNPDIDPLLIMPMFILDFLCIHPFSDGNGRMSRLLTLLLLYQNRYNVGKYISIEKIINNDKDSYYEALQESSVGWHEGENTYRPFARYILGVIVAAYRDFSDRVSLVDRQGKSKPEVIREVIKQTLGNITAAEIKEKCPDISHTTMQRALKSLQESGEITKIGGGRYTSYTWNGEKEK